MEFWSSFFEKTACDNCHTLVCLASFGVSFYFCGSFWLLLVFCSVLKYNFYRFLYVLSAAIIVNSPDQGSLRPSPFPWASRSLLSSKWDLDSRSELEQQSRGVIAEQRGDSSSVPQSVKSGRSQSWDGKSGEQQLQGAGTPGRDCEPWSEPEFHCYSCCMGRAVGAGPGWARAVLRALSAAVKWVCVRFVC